MFTYVFIFGLLFLIGYHVHDYLLEEDIIEVPFSLKNVYIFHAVFSFLICSSLFLLSKIEKFKDQIGFIYLGTFVFKLLVFGIIFSQLFSENLQLSLSHKVSLLIPVFVFLAVEAYFIVKLLVILEFKYS